MKVKPTDPEAMILSGASGDFRPAVVMGQGLPAEINGQKVSYFWKEVLPLGKFRDVGGTEHEVDRQRIDLLLSEFQRARSKGFKPFCPTSHNARDGASNLGFVVDARKNDKGNLETLHQIIGDDAAQIVARNGASICTLKDVEDEQGNRYAELIDHVAIVPDPRLTNLDDFKPALAASRGQPTRAVILSLADDKRSAAMTAEQLATIRGLPGLAEVSEADAFIKLIDLAKGKTDAEKLALSRATAAEKERDDVKLQLSRTPNPPPQPDPMSLNLIARACRTEKEKAVQAGGVAPDIADELELMLVGEKGKPNALYLSRTVPGTDDPLPMAVFMALSRNRAGKPLGSQIPGAQILQRPTGAGTPQPEDYLVAAAKQAETFKNQQLAAAGVK